MQQRAEDSFQWTDILRGLAAVGIVLFHSRVPLWIGWDEIRLHPANYSFFERMIAWLALPIPFLGSGVMLFFVVSGFSIHFPTVKRGKIEIIPYFKRRFLRIWPPYFFAVMITLLCEWWIIRYDVPISTLSKYVRTVFMTQNYPPHPGQLESNPSLWSLPVEVELYFIYPIIFFLYKKISKGLAFAVVFLISLFGLIMTVTIWPWMQEDFCKYLIIWCSGAYLAELYRTGKLPKWYNIYWLALIFLAAISFVVLLLKVQYAYIHYVWGLVFLLLLWGVLQLKAPSTYFHPLILKVLLYLGKISYSLYLIHFTIFQLMGKAYQYYFHDKSGNLLICFAAVTIVVWIAGLFYKFIELPFHRIAKKIGKPSA